MVVTEWLSEYLAPGRSLVGLRPISTNMPALRGLALGCDASRRSDASGNLCSRETCEVEIRGECIDQSGFLVLHSRARLGAFVVVAEQVQDAVDAVANDFGLPRGFESPGLAQGLVHADEDIGVKRWCAVRGAWCVIRIVEGDDVG